MRCEIIRNGAIIAGPMTFEPNRVRDIIARQGGDYRLVPNSLTAAVKVGSIIIKPVREVRPALDRMTELAAPERSETDYEVVYTYGSQPRDPEAARADLLRQLASVHEAHDKGRTVHRGVSIAVDLEARINATAVLDAFKSGQMMETQWNGQAVIDTEGNAGPSEIPVTSTADMQAIYDAIFGHLQLGFAAKAHAKTLLSAATATELASMDVQADFDDFIAAAKSA